MHEKKSVTQRHYQKVEEVSRRKDALKKLNKLGKN